MLRWPLIVVLLSVQVFASDFGFLPTERETIISTTIEPVERAELPEYAQFITDLSNYVPSQSLQCVRDELVRIRLTQVKQGEETGTWLANGGVVSDYQLKMANNPCFAVLVSTFYDEIRRDFNISTDQDDTLPNGRPSLNARAGQGSFSDVEPGELWKRALKKANNDPNLALELIGYCGHDDVFQNAEDNIISTQNRAQALMSVDYLRSASEQNYISDMTAASSTGEVMNFLNTSNGVLFQSLRQEVQKGQNLYTRVACPARNSKFYVPGALDKDAVLPTDFVNEVARLQAPTQGAQALPGKAYHTNFAAVLSCRLKSRCGLPHELVRQISSGLVSTYRNVRLTALTGKYLKLKEMIEKKFQVSWNDRQEMSELDNEIKQYIEAEDEAVFDLQMDNELIEIVDQFKFKLKWDKIKDFIDASLYYRGGQLNQNTTLMPLSAGRDPYYDSSRWGSLGRPPQSYCPGWSEERCNKARNRYETWVKDKEWSVKQNLLGVDFALNKCPSQEKPLSQSSCDAVRAGINERQIQARIFYCRRNEE